MWTPAIPAQEMKPETAVILRNQTKACSALMMTIIRVSACYTAIVCSYITCKWKQRHRRNQQLTKRQQPCNKGIRKVRFVWKNAWETNLPEGSTKLVNTAKEGRSIVITSKAHKRTGGGVHGRVTGRQDTGEDDGINDMGACFDTSQLEDQGKWGGARSTVRVLQIRIVVGDAHSDQQNSTNVKDDDTPEGVANSARYSLCRVLCFTSSDTNYMLWELFVTWAISGKFYLPTSVPWKEKPADRSTLTVPTAPLLNAPGEFQ